MSKRQLDQPTASNQRNTKRQKAHFAPEIQLQPSGKLPPSIDVEKFTEARGFEIHAINAALKSAKSNSAHRVWQTLPRHLRRRAASHDVRRVPARLRDRARSEMDPPKKKGANQIVARRGKDKRVSRTASFARRQKDKTWLETHLWHAKRMHMHNLWGYRLAVKSTEKSFRPSHRASMQGTIMHDASYIGSIELIALLPHLKLLLSHCCDPQGTSPAAIRFSSGSRICERSLYKMDSFPHGLLAPVEILWKPEDKTADTNQARTMWIRVHPSAFEEVLETLRQAASRVLDDHRKTSQEECTIQITDLRDQFNTFEFSGPQSSRVIWQILSLTGNEARKDNKQFWRALPDLDTPASLPRGMIVGLTVLDPRLRTKRRSILKRDKPLAMPFPSASLATSNLWCEKTRLALVTPRYKTKDLNIRRSKQDIPGTQLDPKRQDDRIPLLLIQRSLASQNPRLESSNAVHGWTLIVPKGWGMPFLLAFSQAGIRIGGLRDRSQQATESGSVAFPQDYPATSACKELVEAEAEEDRQTWERKPPAKRPSWDKLGTRSPWKPDWDVVLGLRLTTDEDLMACDREDNQGTESEISIWHFQGSKSNVALENMISSTTPDKVLLDWVNNLRVQGGLERLTLDLKTLLNSALITVQIAVTSRGALEPHAHIYYLPDDEAKEWARLHSQGREAFENEDSEAVKFAKQFPSQALIIGYVSSGGYSLNRGEGFAIGHVSLARMLDLCRQSKRLTLSRSLQNLVKVRNRDSDMCRSAVLRAI